RGLFLDQNRATLRANGVGLVEVTGFTAAPELYREQWRDRVDTTVVLRREVRYDYSVLNILRAKGTITANRPGDDPGTVETDFDTGVAEDVTQVLGTGGEALGSAGAALNAETIPAEPP